jgi:hypothetical protein
MINMSKMVKMSRMRKMFITNSTSQNISPPQKQIDFQEKVCPLPLQEVQAGWDEAWTASLGQGTL